MNLEQMKKDMSEGVILCRATFVALVDHALELKNQRDRFAAFVATRSPVNLDSTNETVATSCQTCNAVAPFTTDSVIEHEEDCLYVIATQIVGEPNGQLR